MVLHIAVVLQSLGLGPQNEGGGFNNTGNQIKVAQDTTNKNKARRSKSKFEIVRLHSELGPFTFTGLNSVIVEDI